MDDYYSPQLSPVADVMIQGARIVYGHFLLQKEEGMGYLSDWANKEYPNLTDRNAFYAGLGAKGSLDATT